MSTLPPGVTLERLDRHPSLRNARRVERNGALLGYVFEGPSTHRWHARMGELGGLGLAATADPKRVHRGGAFRRLFATRDQAIRWVCLQARPAVVTVRRVPGAGPDCWDLSIPVDGVSRHMVIRDTPHAEAMTIAMAIALMEATR